MAHIKKQLLETLIRQCVTEVLDQLSEDDTIGAPAPPASNLGTADQPPLPKETTPELPTPHKGIILINPRNTAKLQPVPIKYENDAKLERDLFNVASSIGGPNIKISLNTVRMAKDSSRNPATPVYLFIGKFDPESDELFLLADRDINTAKQGSISPHELGSPSLTAPQDSFEPLSASPEDFATRMKSGGQTPKPEIDELKRSIKKIIREVFY